MINSVIQVLISCNKKKSSKENENIIFNKTIDLPAKPSKDDLIPIVGTNLYLEVDFVAFTNSEITPLKVFTKEIKMTKKECKKLTKILKNNDYIKIGN